MVIGLIVANGRYQVDQPSNNDVQNALPAEGPWSSSWDKLSTAAGNVLSNVVQQETNVAAKMPWEVSGTELSSVAGNKRPPIPDTPVQTQPQKQVFSFGDIFSRLVNTESGGKHVDANGNLLASNKGAQGITQVLPKTGDNPGYGVTPIQNNSQEEYLRFGKDYLNAMLKNFGGNQEQAVAAYNAGPGKIEKAVQKAQVTGGDWKSYIPVETQKYVRKILG